MKTKTVNLYEYAELSDSAKERARQWWTSLVFDDSNDWEAVFEDAEQIAGLLGITFDQNSVKLMSGATRHDPAIYFSGFSSQGDGACFEGSYSYVKGSVKKVKDYAPQDQELHRIAETLQRIQKSNFYALTATMKHRGYYSHSGCMSVDVERSDEKALAVDTEEEVTQLMRDFADWIYDQMQKEYEYQTSDEAAVEAIEANGYTFDENGNRED